MIFEERKNRALADYLAPPLLHMKKDANTKLDASTVLADLSNADEITSAEVSLEALRIAVAGGRHEELAGILTSHVLVLDALALKLLHDAQGCKSAALTATIIELALKTFDTARRTIIATSEINTAKAPLIALQVNT